MSTIRAGGAAIALGSFVFICTIILFLTVLAPPSNADGSPITLGQRGDDLLARAAFFKLYWTIEAVAMGILTAGAFLIAFRGNLGSWSALGFGLLGVGSLANIAMYSFVLGTYFAVAGVAETQPILLEAANASALAIFFVANALAFLGVAILFAMGISGPASPLPRWANVVGTFAGILVFAAACAGPIVGAGIMSIAGPGALTGYALLVWMGLKLFRTDAIS
ncbi:MAG: hypothetical protein HRT81_09945 [Henriciella sp.]|nr:hypothetical protein [Henriciella sp.]